MDKNLSHTHEIHSGFQMAREVSRHWRGLRSMVTERKWEHIQSALSNDDASKQEHAFFLQSRQSDYFPICSARYLSERGLATKSSKLAISEP